MIKLLIATNNPAKLREYREILRDLPLVLTSLAQEGIDLVVKERGRSYAENAISKARAYARASGLLTLADDSGLEVKALDGEPGILSSRYAGPGASDEKRNQFLLHRLQGIPWERRRARFRCTIAIATPEGEVQIVEGTCEGVIALEPRGKHGFGYDPIFYLPQCGCTMAELPPEVKNRISHRAQAAQKAKRILNRMLER